MDFPDYLNVDCSEDDADDAAELEAHLYSKIYYEEEEQDTDATQATTSVRLYTENEVSPPPDSGIGSLKEDSSPNDDVTKADDDVTKADDDVSKADDDVTKADDDVIRIDDDGTDDVIIIDSDEEMEEPVASTSTAAKRSKQGQSNKHRFNVDEFISNVFDGRKIRQKNPFYVDDDDDESDTTETTESSEVVVCSSGNDETRYTESNKNTIKDPVSGEQEKEKKPAQNRRNTSSSSSSSSEEDEGIQIIREVDVALERSLRAELVDLIESEGDQDSELELDENNDLHKSSSKKLESAEKISAIKPVGATSSKSGTPKTGKADSTPMSRKKARAGKVVVQREKTPAKTKTSAHFVAAKNAESSSDDSSDSSDSEPGFSLTPRLSLNLSGGSLGRQSDFQTFQQITGMLPGAHKPNKNRFASWTPEMQKFYDDLDPKMADVTIDDLIATLPTDANWSVGAKDRYTSPGRGGFSGRRNNRYFNSPNFVACSVCGQKGHRPNNCTRRDQDQRKCFMCGDDNHSKFSCPKMMCLRCGLAGMPYTSSCNRCRNILETICHQCGAAGHLAQGCPDHWRRFHLTTEPGNIVRPKDEATVNYSNIWCSNCSRRGHFVHQCRAFSASQHPKSILSVVSYQDTRKRKHVAEEEEVVEPDSAKRKRLKLELKEKRRAFRSFPHTPTTPNEFGSGRRGRKNFSEPASPFDPNLDLSVFSVTRNLNEAKEKLIQMTTEKFNPKKKNGGKKFRRESKINGNNFTKKLHEPQPFPRGGPRGSKKKPRHNSEFGAWSEPTNRNRRSVDRMVDWKNRQKNQRLRKKKGDSENFIKI